MGCDKEDDVGEEKRQPACFLLLPAGSEISPSQPATNALISEIVRSVLEEIGFSLTIPETPSSGFISIQTIGHLVRDQLVIADLTGLNPNVMYEVGVRHCARLPLVILAERGTKLPFEVQSEEVFFYDTGLVDRKRLSSCLKQKCEQALADKRPNNPVYRAAETGIVNGAVEDPYIMESRRSALRYPRKHRMPPAPRISPDEVVVDWIEAEGDGAAIRNLADQIGGMGFILAARFFKVDENKTRIEFRHLNKTPSTYIVMKYLTREGFKVTDASVNSEPFNPEPGTE